MTTGTAPAASKRSDREAGLIVVVGMAAVMWVVEVIDQVTSANLDSHGIRPHDGDGLIGIAFAPFLHAGFNHLISNTVPFLVLGATIALSGLGRVLATTAIVALVGGLGVWLFAPAGTDHIGASGLVFGYATYLMARGFYSRSVLHLVVGIVVFAIYGGTLLFGVVPQDGISWQGHLFGGIGGVLAAWLIDRRRDEAERAGRLGAAGAGASLRP